MTLEPAVGAALMLLVLADIVLTVLYARAGTGLLAPSWNRAVWASLRALATLSGRRRGAVLSLAGPLIVVLLIGFWALGLTVAAALMVQPGLGTAIRPSSGATPTDFVTALLVAGNSLSIVGGGEYSPHTTGTRILFLVDSLVGTSVLSLVLSYLVQVYSSLRDRNALALTIDLMTGRTGDAAEMLARLMPGGDCSTAVSELGNLARALAATKEAHHFYPLLFYFRFEDPAYAVSRFGFVLLDLTTLIGTAIDRQQYGSLVRSAAVMSLRQGTLLLLETLDRNFPTVPKRAEAAATGRDRQSYAAAVDTLERAGIAARPDGIDRYGAERRTWEPLVRRVAPSLGYGLDDIDRRGRIAGPPRHAGGPDELGGGLRTGG
ncbi:two pore domain potassium channel family protein [Lichenibacterium ramalinae]|uniref:two pore domain potassium channel family protein n=1 Tax=Lichenibacterium ramalinae TaxID=2316527 RepID=UPI001A92D07F|nr:two pore domain potassium channel family protein [Lichenibacterium ramalinae]